MQIVEIFLICSKRIGFISFQREEIHSDKDGWVIITGMCNEFVKAIKPSINTAVSDRSKD
jgi:hypothetical protein